MQPLEATSVLFKNREDAGLKLADSLTYLKDRNPVVLGLPRGGVIVAAEVAAALCAPLNVIVARKLGAPFQPELGIGSVASGGVVVIDRILVKKLNISEGALEQIRSHEQEELEHREQEYREVLPQIQLTDRVAIVVDDGLATGVTALAAVRAVRQQHPSLLVAAFPVCSSSGMQLISQEADEVVCTSAPAQLRAVGQWYADFTQTTDQEVIEALGRKTC